MATVRTCHRCGAVLGEFGSDGGCPACLLQLALEETGYGRLSGEQVGPFVLVRPLGRGGMGEVYEAVEIEGGRRVALKILAEQDHGPGERERFLREGRLAASIRDEHVVYVFGTYETDGVMAIAMELVDGGTLGDRVAEDGPLALSAAVDAILQVIAGLECAAAMGVLHRDVKPSNCFVDRHGIVKVGDFGLSISAAELDVTRSTAARVMGTPAFASPEQIRGDAIDIRSDIYSTAGTLHYLLTGQPPFGGRTLVEVIASVLENDIEPLERHRPDLPYSVARCVRRCLSRNPSDRPATYQELRDQLSPFSSAMPPAAGAVPRLSAAVIDGLLLGLAGELVAALWVSPGATPDHMSPWRAGGEIALGALYFAVTEGVWGASVGKALCRLQIVRADGRPVGMTRAFVRAAVYQAVDLSVLSVLVLAPGSALTSGRRAAIELLMTLALFSGSRRGRLVGLHDRASGTQVVRRRTASAREPIIPATGTSAPREPVGSEQDHVGPYSIITRLSGAPGATLLLGYDPVLQRRVWILTGADSVSAARRDLHRPGRLRWLCGRHTGQEQWDAFEAPDGLPFSTIVRDRLTWAAVRFWLVDLAEELEAALSDPSGELVLDPERIWIATNGRAIVLDFPAPSSGTHEPPAHPSPGATLTTASAQHFLNRVVMASLVTTAPGCPLPMGTRSVLTRLKESPQPDFSQVVAALRLQLDRAACLTARRRLAHLGLSVALPAAAVAATAGFAVADRTFAPDRLIAPLAASLLLMATLGIWSAALFRGGLVLGALGIGIALPNGEEASRHRALLRGILAWSPSLVVLVAISFGALWAGIATTCAWAAAALVPAWTLGRGLQDRLAGTHLVPK
ncbi:MAG: protein kinase [Vicinamibacterales bacterium]